MLGIQTEVQAKYLYLLHGSNSDPSAANAVRLVSTKVQNEYAVFGRVRKETSDAVFDVVEKLLPTVQVLAIK